MHDPNDPIYDLELPDEGLTIWAELGEVMLIVFRMPASNTIMEIPTPYII